MVSFNDFIIRNPQVYKRFTGKELTFLLMHKEVFIKNHSKQFTIVFTIIKQKSNRFDRNQSSFGLCQKTILTTVRKKFMLEKISKPCYAEVTTMSHNITLIFFEINRTTSVLVEKEENKCFI